MLLESRGSLLTLEKNVPSQSSDALPLGSPTRTSERNKVDAQEWSRILIQSSFGGLDHTVIPNSRDANQSTHILILSTATDPYETDTIKCNPVSLLRSFSNSPIIDE
jgi:hypothetical protein